MKITKLIEKPNKRLSNILLLVALFLFIFIVPIFPPSYHSTLIDIFFSLMFFLGIYALDNVNKSLLIVAIFAFITQWISRIFNMNVLIYLSDITNILFLQLIIIRLIIQIAKSKQVNASVMFESINGYLFMGLFFAVWVALIFKSVPGAFNGLDPETSGFHEILYFTYVTLTTLGYGEITPQLPLAKSLSILISTSGQLYVAVIIAMLVGKYAASQNK